MQIHLHPSQFRLHEPESSWGVPPWHPLRGRNKSPSLPSKPGRGRAHETLQLQSQRRSPFSSEGLVIPGNEIILFHSVLPTSISFYSHVCPTAIDEQTEERWRRWARSSTEDLKPTENWTPTSLYKKRAPISPRAAIARKAAWVAL